MRGDKMIFIQVHHKIIQCLERNRRSDLEEYTDILQRMLYEQGEQGVPEINAGSHSWIKNGVELPSGTLFRFSYNQILHEGQIVDGAWIHAGLKFGSPNQFIKTIVPFTGNGNPAVINTWLNIQVKKPLSDEWVLMHSLRKKVAHRGLDKSK